MVFPSRRITCPRGSPVPNCRDGLVRFLLIAVPGRSLRPRGPMTSPSAWQRCGRSFIHSQPSASERSHQRQKQGGFLRPPARAKPYPTWWPGCRIDKGGDPCRSRGLSACFGVRPLLPCKTGHASPVQLMLTALRVHSNPDGSWGLRLCRGHAVWYNSVLYLLRRISIIPQLSSTRNAVPEAAG